MSRMFISSFKQVFEQEIFEEIKFLKLDLKKEAINNKIK